VAIGTIREEYVDDDGLVRIDSALLLGLSAASLAIHRRYGGVDCGLGLKEHIAIHESACRVSQWDGTWSGGRLQPPLQKGAEPIFAVILRELLEPPVIRSVIPNTLPVVPLGQRQLLTINGIGFLPTSTLKFNDGAQDYLSNPAHLRIISSTKIEYDIAVGPVPANWTVKVVNDSVLSNAFPFFVTTTPDSTDSTAPPAPISLTATPQNWSSSSLFWLDWTNPSDPSGIAKVWWKLGSAPTSPNDGLAYDLPLFKPSRQRLIGSQSLPAGTRTRHLYNSIERWVHRLDASEVRLDHLRG
jgi:hypothetical protein